MIDENVLAEAVRKEIVRQYRDNDRGNCPAGLFFWEQEIQPMLIAQAVMTVLRTETNAGAVHQVRKMIDIVDLDTNVSMHVRDAIADVVLTGHSELIGRLVQELVDAGTLNAEQLCRILPPGYEVRED